MGVSVVAIERNSLFELFDGRCQISRSSNHETKLVVGLGKFRIKDNGFLERLSCSGELAMIQRLSAALELCLSRGTGPPPRRFLCPIPGCRFVQRLSERVVRLARLRVQLERALECLNRASEIPLLPERLSDLIFQFRTVRMLFTQGLKLIEGGVGIPFQTERHAQIDPHCEVAGRMPKSFF